MPDGLPLPAVVALMQCAGKGGGAGRPRPAESRRYGHGMDARRLVPRTDTVLADPRLAAAAGRLGRERVKAAVVRAQQQARDGEIDPAAVADAAVAALPARAGTLTSVINATGVLLHTNLGRAPLSAAARDAVSAAAGCTDLEFDLASGTRGKRGRGALAALAAAVPAAEAVHVVNNNAAALVLAATALAGPDGGREIVVSRGELIEIGDRFRLPDLLESTGARIREVGTTNRTTAADYAAAIGPATAFVLKVHPSNYRIEGFTASVGVAELAALGAPVVGDIGSGLLARHPLLPDEPDADSWLRAGAALVTASGDKLLGGPQAGLLLGRASLVTALARHPLARALRVGKLTIAALEATLAGPPPPVAAALAASQESLTSRARQLAGRLTGTGVPAEVVACAAAVGGGGAPGVALPSAGVLVPGSLASRRGPRPPARPGPAGRGGEAPAVVGRAEGTGLLLDLRSVAPEDDGALAAAVGAAARGRPGSAPDGAGPAAPRPGRPPVQ
jgi:L-seryl-tRNA(Ser) seleniumtransferase